MKKKIALIFGVTGQDGSYLSQFLLKKGYEVHGIKRRSSSFNTARIDHIYQDPHKGKPKFLLHYGDVTDAISVSGLIKKIKPDEIYNLAAQSFVQSSFNNPYQTTIINSLAVLFFLETIKTLKLDTSFYQASTSEMFGNINSTKQNVKRSCCKIIWS